jgi:hypothetical protein
VIFGLAGDTVCSLAGFITGFVPLWSVDFTNDTAGFPAGSVATALGFTAAGCF